VLIGNLCTNDPSEKEIAVVWRLEEAAERLSDKICTENCKLSKRLVQRVREILKKSPSTRWYAAVRAIVDAEGDGAR
jgi:hypothetical protein